MLFSRLQTQWFAGMGGYSGLRYEALYPLLDRRATSADDWDQLLEDVQTMEMAALKQMSEDRPDT